MYDPSVPRTVLVIDDEPSIVRMISRVLAELPCEVLTAYDAESAVEIIASHEPDLVITDIRLPGMDGLELTEHIKVKNPALPVLLVSAYGEPRTHGGDAFIPKPFDNDQLIATVRRCLQLQARTTGYGDGAAWPFTTWFGDRPS